FQAAEWMREPRGVRRVLPRHFSDSPTIANAWRMWPAIPRAGRLGGGWRRAGFAMPKHSTAETWRRASRADIASALPAGRTDAPSPTWISDVGGSRAALFLGYAERDPSWDIDPGGREGDSSCLPIGLAPMGTFCKS